jgi:serine/threonine protein kinase
VRARLGRGGFGDVYRAYDPTLRREVAIKTATLRDATSRQRFRREAEIAAGLVHPRIVTLHDLGEAEGRPFLVQELLPGEDLSRLLERGEPRSFSTRCTILRDVTEGLSFAHARLIVHRDVKPDNVRVLPDGRAKILDFGIARADLQGRVAGDGETAAAAPAALTETGMALGTLAYLAPEVLRGEPARAAADVWGLGALAFELLTFRRPFAARTPAALVYDIAHAPIPRLGPGTGLGEDLPRSLADWVGRCLTRDLGQRFPDAREALEALDTLGRETGTSAPVESSDSDSSGGSGTRRRAGWGAIVALVLAGLALVVASRFRARTEPPSTSEPLTVTATPTSPAEQGSALPEPAVSPPSPAAAAAGLPAAPLSSAAAPTAVSTAAPVRLALDARPWGTVTRVVDDQGVAATLPRDRRTPLSLVLPARAWRITLVGPDGASERTCTIDLSQSAVGSGSHICRVAFGRVDVEAFLRDFRGARREGQR